MPCLCRLRQEPRELPQLFPDVLLGLEAQDRLYLLLLLGRVLLGHLDLAFHLGLASHLGLFSLPDRVALLR